MAYPSNSDLLQVKDRFFKPYIHHEAIIERVAELGEEIKEKFEDLNPVFLPVLNGSFMFAADLMKVIQFPSEIEFINAKSYAGTSSTGVVKVETFFKKPIKGRHIIIIEDIIDTGFTIQKLRKTLMVEEPASVSVVSLLIKPESFEVPVSLDYFGFKIANEFVVGYGLDYDGQGRNILGIYQEANVE